MFSKPYRIFRKMSSVTKFTKSILIIAVLVSVCSGLMACNTPASVPVGGPTSDAKAVAEYTGKKILFVNSYHEGYEWSDGIESGLQEVLKDTGVEVKFVRMDTKNNPSVEFAVEAGKAAKAEIDAFQPDVLIAADDNAQKYVIVPYYMGSSQPVVFCGINWDASNYNYPASNITGMIEVELPDRLIEHLETYAKGQKVGYLTVDSETERSVAAIYNERFFNGEMEIYWVETWEDYKATFIQAQAEVDILFLGNNAGIDYWNLEEAEKFVVDNIEVPTGSINDWMAPYALITLAKSSYEQGEWAAQAALRILKGTPASEIPLVENKIGELILNLDLADKLGVVFPPSLLKVAEIYE